MADIVYSLKEHKMVDERELGVMGTISFERIASLMRSCGELIDGETITQFTVTKRGLEFRVEGNTDG